MVDTPNDTLERVYLEYEGNRVFHNLKKDATQIVRGEGPLDPTVIFVGEAPGATEDKVGRPFQGQAGNVFNSLLNKIDVDRDDVFVTNIVKYRPKDNRDPTYGEIIQSAPYLDREIGLLDSSIIVTLGRHALSYFFPELMLSRSHGQVQNYGSKFLIPMYHPAYALYDRSKLVVLQEDMEKLGELLDSLDADKH